MILVFTTLGYKHTYVTKYYNKPYNHIKYLHLIKLGAIKGMMVNFLEAISVQHPRATDEVCHFR